VPRKHVTKILCHPQDGGPYCVYNPKTMAYAMYFTDEEITPDPRSLQIVTHRGLLERDDLQWVPVVSIVGNPDEKVQIYGEYNDMGDTV
jgi:hypothetical protein